MYKVCLKRVIDMSLSFFAIIFLSWLFVMVAVLIKVTSKGSVFFLQERVGKNNNNFMILKFRTMRMDTPSDTATHLLKDAQQFITPIGKLLRKTSLDELPQLFNILKGDMSIVGPRPALWNQYDLIEERTKYCVNDVRPGLTGWAQINGRDEILITEKARLDGYYVHNMSFLFDLKCMLRTISYVFRHDGIKEGVIHNSNEKDTNNRFQ